EARRGAWFVDAAGEVGFQHGHEKRSIVLPGVNRQASGSDNGTSGGIQGLVAWRLTSGSLAIEPTAGVSWAHVSLGAIRESGAGGADLDIGSLNQDATQSQLGVRLAKTTPLSGGSLTLQGGAAWTHEFERLTPHGVESFAAVAGTNFEIAGADPG